MKASMQSSYHVAGSLLSASHALTMPHPRNPRTILQLILLLPHFTDEEIESQED